jgi:hypothetical protein
MHSEHSLTNGDSWHHLHCYKTTRRHELLGLHLLRNTMRPLLQSQLKIVQTTLFMRSSKTTVNKMLLVFPLGCPLRYQHRCPAPQLQPCMRAVSKRPHLRRLSLRTLTPPTHTHLPNSNLRCCHFQGCLHHQVPCHSASPLPIAHGHA